MSNRFSWVDRECMRISGYTLLLSNKRWEPDPQPATPSIECRNLCDGKANSFVFFCVCCVRWSNVYRSYPEHLNIDKRKEASGEAAVKFEEFSLFSSIAISLLSFVKLEKDYEIEDFSTRATLASAFRIFEILSNKKFPFIAFDFRFSSLFFARFSFYDVSSILFEIGAAWNSLCAVPNEPREKEIKQLFCFAFSAECLKFSSIPRSCEWAEWNGQT